MSNLLGSEKLHTGELRVYDDHVHIARSGLSGVAFGSKNKELDIQLADVAMVDFKDANFAANGHIRFVLLGDAPTDSMGVNVASDPHTVLFTRGQRDQAKALKAKIDQAMSGRTEVSDSAVEAKRLLSQQVQVKEYSSSKEMEADMRLMLAAGWTVQGQHQTEGHVNIGRTAGKFLLTGIPGLLIGGRDKTQGKQAVTYVKEG